MPISTETEAAYRILGLEPGATPLEIRRAYRARVKEWHPDRYANDPARQRAAEEKMKAINEAYATLRSLNPAFHVHARRARRAEASPPSPPPAYDTIYCLRCRAPMSSGAGVCPACGEDQREVLRARKVAESEALRQRREERREMRRVRFGGWLGAAGEFLGTVAVYLFWAVYLLLRLLLGR